MRSGINPLHLEMKPVNYSNGCLSCWQNGDPSSSARGLWREELALNSTTGARRRQMSRPSAGEPVVRDVSSLHTKGRTSAGRFGGHPGKMRGSASTIGPGLSAAERHRLFDPFLPAAIKVASRGVGLHPGSRRRSGAGAKSGASRSKSEGGQGCSFRIWLPLTRPPADRLSTLFSPRSTTR